MIEIFAASKVLVDSLNTSDELLVCVRGEKGTVLFITELKKYLKGRGRGRSTGKLLKTRNKTPRHAPVNRGLYSPRPRERAERNWDMFGATSW